MPDEPVDPSADLTHAFLELKAAAKELNDYSDKLGKPVAELDKVLKELNLGVSAWVRMFRYEHERDHGEYSYCDLGYAKVDRTWGIALEEGTGHEAVEEEEIGETWLFSDAPRRLRVEAIKHLPALIQALTREARITAEGLKSRIADAERVVQAVKTRAIELPLRTTTIRAGNIEKK